MTELRLEEGERPARLLAGLDDAWWQFVAGLPTQLQDLARKAGTFQGSEGGEKPFGGPSRMNPGITCTPWLFWEVVHSLDDEEFVALAHGGALAVLASVILDHLVDGQLEPPGIAALLHQALYEAGTARLRAILPRDSPFWEEFDRLGAEHVAGLASECLARQDPDLLTLERFLELVPKKFSPIVVTMAAFAHAVGRPDLLQPIEASIKHLAVASQILDDMGDWQEDLEQRRLTLYLTRLAPRDAWTRAAWPSAGEIQARIDAEWADIEWMGVVKGWLDRSLEAVTGLECSAWQRYVRGYGALADRHLARYTARHLLRAVAPLVGERTRM